MYWLTDGTRRILRTLSDNTRRTSGLSITLPLTDSYLPAVSSITESETEELYVAEPCQTFSYELDEEGVE